MCQIDAFTLFQPPLGRSSVSYSCRALLRHCSVGR